MQDREGFTGQRGRKKLSHVIWIWKTLGFQNPLMQELVFSQQGPEMDRRPSENRRPCSEWWRGRPFSRTAWVHLPDPLLMAPGTQYHRPPAQFHPLYEGHDGHVHLSESSRGSDEERHKKCPLVHSKLSTSVRSDEVQEGHGPLTDVSAGPYWELFCLLHSFLEVHTM